MKLLICFGTRPEWIKIKPILEKLGDNVEYKTLFTGQHQDIVAKDLADYNLPPVQDFTSNRLDNIVSSIFTSVDGIVDEFDYVLVQGDTTSVLALAMSAFHRGKKVIHLEAGLRTYDTDNPFPEEFNRAAVSRIADIHLCPTEQNKENLLKENASGRIFVTGNTVLDNLKGIETDYNKEVIVTLHRRENHENIREWFTAVSKIAKENKDLTFTIPLHPNPNVRRHRDALDGVNVIAPLPHPEMIERIAKSRLIISDSGGIQEEASFFNKKIIVCRKVTERPESVGTHSAMCDSPCDLEKLFYEIRDDYEIDEPCPYGDGNSAERISNILTEVLDVL